MRLEVGNVNIKVIGDLDNSIIYDLSTAMTYKTLEFNGFNFITLEHHLFNKLKQSFPTGLFSKAADVFDAHNITYDVVDNRIKPAVNKPLKLYGVKLRPYQQGIVDTSDESQRFVIQIATGGGKTIIAGAILAKLNVSSIFVVHTGDLFEQAYDDLRELLRVPIGKIGGGTCDIQKINVCMIQTIHSVLDKKYIPFDEIEKEQMEEDEIVKKSFIRDENVKKFIQSVQCVMIDECQHISARTYIETIKACRSAYFKIAMSATPETGQGKDMILQAYAGKIISRVSASYLIKNEYLVRPKIYYLQGSKNSKYKFSRKRYNSIYKTYIVNNLYRNTLIVDCVKRLKSLNKSVLITVTTKKHGHLLTKMINEVGGISVEFIYSHVDKMVRKKYINQVRNRQLDVLVGTSLDHNETIWIRNSKRHVDLVKIGDFVEKYLTHFDEQYETLSFLNNKIVWKRITHVHRHECKNNVLRVRLKSGRIALVTENHSLISYDNRQLKKVLPELGNNIVTALRLPLNQVVKVDKFDLLYEFSKCPFVEKLEVRLDRNQSFMQFNNSTMRFIKSEYLVLKKQCRDISGDTEKDAVKRLENKDQFYKDFVIWFNENVKYKKRKYRCSVDSVLKFKHRDKLKAKIFYKRSRKGDFGLPFILKNSVKLGQICGMLIGDGHMTKGSFCLCFKGQTAGVKFVKEKSVELMEECLRTIFPDLKFKRGHGGTTGIKIAGKLMAYLIADIFGMLGNALVKKVPQFIFNSSKEIQMGFLYGYFLTDGSFNNKYSFTFVSVSKQLLDGVIGILLNNDINNFSFKCRKPNVDLEGNLLKSEHRIRSKNWGYQLTVKHNLFDLGRTPDMNTRPGQSYLKLKVNDKFANVPITKIENLYPYQTSQPKYVYDISVEDTEVFFNGPGVLCHNSLADEGLNIPALDSLILAGAGKSPTRMIQRIGRTLRPSDGKTEAIVIDFKDNVRYLLGHYKKRREICEQESEFEIIDGF